MNDAEVRMDESPMNRRSLLRGAALGAGGIAAAVLIGCGSDDDDVATGDGTGASSTATGQAVDMGDDKRGRCQLEDTSTLRSRAAEIRSRPKPASPPPRE